jgi:hypothetical protein
MVYVVIVVFYREKVESHENGSLVQSAIYRRGKVLISTRDGACAEAEPGVYGMGCPKG